MKTKNLRKALTAPVFILLMTVLIQGCKKDIPGPDGIYDFDAVLSSSGKGVNSKGFLKFIGKINLHSSLQLMQKEQANGLVELNPFKSLLKDTALITRNIIFVNTFSFNKLSRIPMRFRRMYCISFCKKFNSKCKRKLTAICPKRGLRCGWWSLCRPQRVLLI